MMDKIFIEENNYYQIDLTDSIWATDKLNQIFTDAKVQLSDVDFVAETENEILFIEYKNSNIPNAIAPQAFKPGDDKSINRVVRKYYDSLTYINALNKDSNKRKIYIYILETPNVDSVTLKRLCFKLKNKLPFKLQTDNKFDKKIIDDVKVVSINDWNKLYPNFPLTQTFT